MEMCGETVVAVGDWRVEAGKLVADDALLQLRVHHPLYRSPSRSLHSTIRGYHLVFRHNGSWTG